MIPLAEINAAAKKYKVPAETIEKDYVISWILVCLAQSKLKNNFIFYGGTAIKKIYFDDHRFSEDIDLLSSQLYTHEYLFKELQILNYAKDKTNLVLEIKNDTIKYDKNRLQLFIQYTGYEEISAIPKEVRIDLTMNMDLFGKTKPSKLLESYSDLKKPETVLSVMTLNTILGNKLGLLIDSTRNEPRDIFDIWFLLKRSNKFNFNIKEVKNAFYDKYGYYPTLSTLMTHLNKPSLKIKWNDRLRKQVAELPDIKMVIKEIHDILQNII